MKYCPNYSTSLKAKDKNNTYIYKARCKQWSCPYCAGVNKRIWRGRIMNEIESTPEHKIWYFWTLTLLGKDHKGLNHSLQIWRDKWSKLRKRIVRDLGKLRFVRVFEMHKDGTLHIHMLTDKAYKDLKTIAATDKQSERHESAKLTKHLNDLDLGYIHDIKTIETENEEENGIARNVSAYVVKYLTKDVQEFVRVILRKSKTRMRIIQTSHKWYNDTKKDAELTWKQESLYRSEYLAMESYKDAIDLSTDTVITIDDFHEYDHYPNKISDILDAAEHDK
mgnify:CR=1 FL=1